MAGEIDIQDLKKNLRKFEDSVNDSVKQTYKDHLNYINGLRSKKSNYYKEAANTLQDTQNGFNITQEGINLHYNGGIIKAKGKLLTIPTVGTDGNARDYPNIRYRPPKKGADPNTEGYLFDSTGNLKFTLRSLVKIPADKSILPDDNKVWKEVDEAFNKLLK